MHKWLFAFLLVTIPTWGQQSSTGNLTAQGTVCASNTVCITLPLDQTKGGAGFTLSGTWSATVQFEGSADGGVTFQALNATPSNSTTAVTSATGNGVWQANVAGFTHVRIRCSAFSSGTIVATINGSSASARTSGSGGSGTGLTQAAATPATCTPGTTAPVQLTVTPYAIYTCTATNTWSPQLQLGFSNPEASVTTITNAGSFGSGINEYFLNVVGGTTCPSALIINSGSSTAVTNGIEGCIVVPSGAGVTNGFNVGVMGLAQNNNSSSAGQFGKAIAVGLYGAVQCNAANSKCIGSAPQVYSEAGAGIVLEGEEMGVSPHNTTDTGYGILMSFEGESAQPAGDQMPAVVLQTPSSTGTWTSGFVCQDGAISSTSNIDCLGIHQTAAGLSQNSSGVRFYASDASAGFNSVFQLQQGHSMLMGSSPNINIGSTSNATYGGGWGIALKATAALATFGTLVKIDTANADSVVICTTADTSCDGFVADKSLCTIGSTLCGIITTPGSVAKGILGTGTCSIGNYVIVDTTTNGRIQCTGSLPTISKIIGKALSAQASVGSTVDILTKFE